MRFFLGETKTEFFESSRKQHMQNTVSKKKCVKGKQTFCWAWDKWRRDFQQDKVKLCGWRKGEKELEDQWEIFAMPTPLRISHHHVDWLKSTILPLLLLLLLLYTDRDRQNGVWQTMKKAVNKKSVFGIIQPLWYFYFQLWGTCVEWWEVSVCVCVCHPEVCNGKW